MSKSKHKNEFKIRGLKDTHSEKIHSESLDRKERGGILQRW